MHSNTRHGVVRHTITYYSIILSISSRSRNQNCRAALVWHRVLRKNCAPQLSKQVQVDIHQLCPSEGTAVVCLRQPQSLGLSSRTCISQKSLNGLCALQLQLFFIIVCWHAAVRYAGDDLTCLILEDSRVHVDIPPAFE